MALRCVFASTSADSVRQILRHDEAVFAEHAAAETIFFSVLAAPRIFHLNLRMPSMRRHLSRLGTFKAGGWRWIAVLFLTLPLCGAAAEQGGAAQSSLSPATVIPLAVTTIVAFGGWFVAHWFSARRDTRNKQRDARVQFLREAYKTIAAICDSNDLIGKLPDLQSALNDIQLFGTPEQVELLGKFVSEINSGSANLNDLMAELRDEIRDQLSLEPLTGYRYHIRSEGKIEPKPMDVNIGVANLRIMSMNRPEPPPTPPPPGPS